jgi:hypothetical protein
MGTRPANIDAIYRNGTYPDFDADNKVPGEYLFPHQKDIVQRMEEFETRGAVVVNDLYAGASSRKRKAEQSVVCNVGIVSEPPGSGTTTAMLWYMKRGPRLTPEGSEYMRLKESNDKRLVGSMCNYTRNLYRTYTPDEEPAPPTFVDVDVVVAPPRGIRALKAALQANDIAFVPVTNDAQMEEVLSPTGFDGVTVLLLHSSMHAKFASGAKGLVFGRVVYDWAGSMDLAHGDLTGLFVWVCDSNLFNLLGKDSSLDRRRDPWAKSRGVVYDLCWASFSWIRDPSPFVVRHAFHQVMKSIGAHPPATGIYLSRARHGYGEEPEIQREDWGAAVLTLLVRFDAQVSPDVETFKKSLRSDALKDRVSDQSQVACPICMEEMPQVILRCCTNMLCAPCCAAIMSKGVCPFDRKPIEDMCVLGAAKPLNATRVVQDDLSSAVFGNGKQSWLSHVAHSFSVRPAVVVLFASDYDWHNYGAGLGLSTHLVHMGFTVYRLQGNQLPPARTSQAFQQRSSRLLPPKRALVIGPRTNLNGCSMDAATDVIFFTPPTSQEFMAVLGRVQPPSAPALQKTETARLRLHFFLTERQTLPDVLGLARRGEIKGDYDSRIMDDVASLHVRPLAPSHLLI